MTDDVSDLDGVIVDLMSTMRSTTIVQTGQYQSVSSVDALQHSG